MTNFEHKIVNFIAAVSPWAAPAIPTYFTIHNALTYLLFGSEYDRYFVWVLAIALEFVGLSAVHTVLEFWTWNQKHNEEKAPMFLALIAAVVYIAVILAVNVVLELKPNNMYAAIFARGTLSLLSIPAALIVGVRAQHARRTLKENTVDEFSQAEQAKDNETRRQIRLLKAQQNSGEQNTQNAPVLRTLKNAPVLRTENTPVLRTQNTERSMGFQTEQRENIERYVEGIKSSENRTPGAREIARAVGCAPSYAHTVLKTINGGE